ncbi:MAG: DsbA family protein [Acidobacteriota bacterium]|nr:DsbA family protein [Acidobacteriota bacterium]
MSRLRSSFDTALMLLVLLAVGNGLWRYLSPPAVTGEGAEVDATGLVVPADHLRNTRGGGTIALIEFSDFECPFCGRHARETEPQINAEFVSQKLVTQVFLSFPLSIHSLAQKASEAAECAGKQNRFWEMHEALFANQGALSEDAMIRTAQQKGLDVSTFETCLRGGSTADRVRLDAAEGRRLGVASTPAFFVGTINRDGSVKIAKQISGARQFERFRELLGDMVAGRQSLLKLQLPGRQSLIPEPTVSAF